MVEGHLKYERFRLSGILDLCWNHDKVRNITWRGSYRNLLIDRRSHQSSIVLGKLAYLTKVHQKGGRVQI